MPGCGCPLVFGIDALSAGGWGGQDNRNNNSDGGAGGGGKTVTVTNNQNLPVTGASQYAYYGIFAGSVGGGGGDQKGGGTEQADNNDAILMRTSSDCVQAPANGGEVAATSTGCAGGTDNGAGGSGGFAVVTNTGAVEIYWNDTKGNETGLFGIGALAAGIASGDNIGVCLDDQGTRIRRDDTEFLCPVSISIKRSARCMSGYVSAAPEAAPFVSNPIEWTGYHKSQVSGESS